MKQMKQLKRNQKGFTLVELLVVIAIIGILAVFAVPALFRNIEKAKTADLEGDYSAMKSATLGYYTDNNKLPTQNSDLEAYMDSMPAESAFGGGAYTVASANNKVTLSLPAVKISNKQLEKLVKDIGVGKVYNDTEEIKISDGKLVQGDPGVEIAEGSEITLKLILLDGTSLGGN